MIVAKAEKTLHLSYFWEEPQPRTDVTVLFPSWILLSVVTSLRYGIWLLRSSHFATLPYSLFSLKFLSTISRFSKYSGFVLLETKILSIKTSTNLSKYSLKVSYSSVWKHSGAPAVWNEATRYLNCLCLARHAALRASLVFCCGLMLARSQIARRKAICSIIWSHTSLSFGKENCFLMVFDSRPGVLCTFEALQSL